MLCHYARCCTQPLLRHRGPSPPLACTCTASTPLLPGTSYPGAFDNVGDAAGIAASPAVVHFGGFQPGAVHRQTVRLVNTSPDAALRAHVMPPESPYFKVWAPAGHLGSVVGALPWIDESGSACFAAWPLIVCERGCRPHNAHAGDALPLPRGDAAGAV
jgi:hypothetical protein